jgi:hypothetical protein
MWDKKCFMSFGKSDCGFMGKQFGICKTPMRSIEELTRFKNHFYYVFIEVIACSSPRAFGKNKDVHTDICEPIP